MRRNLGPIAGGIAVGVAILALASWPIRAFQVPSTEEQHLAQGKFLFTVVESFDGKYLGDTPGHLGRAGKLDGHRPRVTLGDPVYRDQELVGRVTRVEWDRSRGSLEIEFGPEPLQRVATGDSVWIWLEGPRAAGE